MDLSKIEGLSDEQLAGITAAHDADVSGLKGKVDQLLTEKKGVQSDSDAQKIALEEARKAATDSEARALESQGKYEEAQIIREDERAKLVATANEERDKHKSALDKYHKGAAKNEALLKVDARFTGAASALLDTVIDVVYSDDGIASTVFKYDGKSYPSVAEFINGVGNTDTWKNLLSGADSSGAGTTQNDGAITAFQKMNKTEQSVYLNKHPEAASQLM